VIDAQAEKQIQRLDLYLRLWFWLLKEGGIFSPRPAQVNAMKRPANSAITLSQPSKRKPLMTDTKMDTKHYQKYSLKSS